MPARLLPRLPLGRAEGDLEGRLARLTEEVNRRLPELVPSAGERPVAVHRAMLHALTSPGKRLRPALALAVAEMLGRRAAAVLDLACAVEMVHACSLIFDDLPSMDDAALRRGRPTVHRVFGEATAQLAGLALLNRAFGVVAEAAHRLPLRRYTAEDLVHHLSAAVGSAGLIGGQALDLASTPEEHDLALLEYIHSHKTGALFIAAGELGAMAADARRRDLETITRFAKNLGLAFQITDDLIDATASAEEAGKDVGQDAGKVTFVSLLGVPGAATLADELLDFAAATVEPLGRRAEPLRELAGFVKRRGRRWEGAEAEGAGDGGEGGGPAPA
ncbi:MAG TPA: polyprenyl synthetase family protein [Thermoanaerobaculia bacterium]|nr:polyprenyl synthetase family protein [Thermoanaerobaculia bacterium]